MSEVRVVQGIPNQLTVSAAPRPESTGQDPGGGGARLGWLDALRGFAALAVVFQHAGPELMPGLYRPSHQWLDAGIFGVFLFFLISGYIVPASLERRGDLRAFWTGRLFRIYPLYLVVFAAAMLLPRAHPGVAAEVFQHPWLSAAADGILLQDLLGLGNGLDVSWTLCYEMVFYYLVSALFLLRAHRRSVPVAVGFALTALALGPVLPRYLLVNAGWGEGPLVGAAALVVVVAMAAVLGGRTAGIRAGVVALGLLGLLLVSVDGRSAVFESMMILATMFTGTVVQRAESGQIRRGYAAACCGFVFLAGLLSGILYAGSSLNQIWTASAGSWCTAFVAAWLVFGLGLLLRKRPMPSALCRLGALSYAVYLAHVPLLSVVEWVFDDTGYAPHLRLGQELLCGGGFLLLVLLVAEVLHRLVELPGQRVGRGLLKRADAHQGKANLAGQRAG